MIKSSKRNINGAFLTLIVIINFVIISRLNDMRDVLVFSLLAIFYCEMLISTFVRKQFLLLLMLLVIWFKYFYIMALIFSANDYSSPFGDISKSNYIITSTYAILIGNSIRLAYLLAARQRPVTAVDYVYQRTFGVEGPKLERLGKLQVLILFGLVSVGILLKASQLGGDFSSRMIASQGSGMLHVLGYVGYFLALAYAFSFAKHPIKVITLKSLAAVLVLSFCGMFFMLSGYRGGFLYPFVFFCIVILFSRLSDFRYSVFLLLVFFVLIFEVNWLTGAVRIIVTRGDDFTLESLASAYSTYKDMYLIPMAFNHIDLTAQYFQKNDWSLISGSYNTIGSSFFNWIPRFIMHEKELTTGALMAVELFPETVTSEGRTSSLTTGVVFESLYNFGLVLGPLFIFSFYWLIFSCIRRLLMGGLVYMLLALLLCWNFGFSIFFDDLGGAINKFLLLLLAGSLTQFVCKGLRGMRTYAS